jgi:hypothetical protein
MEHPDPPAFEKNKTYIFAALRKHTRHPGEDMRFIYERSIIGGACMFMFRHSKAKWRETFTEPQLWDYAISEVKGR